MLHTFEVYSCALKRLNYYRQYDYFADKDGASMISPDDSASTVWDYRLRRGVLCDLYEYS